MQWCHAPQFFITPMIEMHVKSESILNTALGIISQHPNQFFFIKKNKNRVDSFTFWTANPQSSEICKTWEYEKSCFTSKNLIDLCQNEMEEYLIVNYDIESNKIVVFCNGSTQKTCRFHTEKNNTQNEIIEILCL
jgi:hypothetical protein